VLNIRVPVYDQAHPQLTDPVEYMDFGLRNLSIGA
jgi:hypothetical protein